MLRLCYLDERNLTSSHFNKRTPQKVVNAFIIHYKFVRYFSGFIQVNELSIVKAMLVSVVDGVCIFDKISTTFFNYYNLN